MEYPYKTITLKEINDILGKYIIVNLLSSFKTTKTSSLEGYLYTIDPITKTLVLLKEKENAEEKEKEKEQGIIKKEKEEKEEEKEEKEEDEEITISTDITETINNTKNKNKNKNKKNYQIIVIMESVIQTLLINNDIKPLTENEISMIIPNQEDILYIEKKDMIENLKDSLIQYLEKNKIDYTTSVDELSIKIYNDKVEILPPYTESCIKSENYGSKNLAVYHIQKWWKEK
ncbi:hypothetical protein BCR32DRAFT_296266 [Anaeromyces robustus]|uniref:Uncharacterized protein n=1 Tax=Anaeromyces robustus TaxID=1754192 RepID=A0A1Y1WS64_9FUNG|nr:hypothetical protein BCR32DRAFT_296266 [Anaeromyces robustus]|eukprot:ORX76383.1 hypothetical protein BCR32DRAFT_296266 [Anaeromyces robustus]